MSLGDRITQIDPATLFGLILFGAIATVIIWGSVIISTSPRESRATLGDVWANITNPCAVFVFENGTKVFVPLENGSAVLPIPTEYTVGITRYENGTRVLFVEMEGREIMVGIAECPEEEGEG